MINLTIPLLVYQIQQYQLLDINVLKNILPKQFPFIFFSNLIFDSQINNTNYVKLKKYLQQLFNQYFSIDTQYIIDEQQYLIFYTLLKVQYGSFLNTNMIISEYNHLPVLKKDNPLIDWVVYKIKLDMLDYYNFMNNETAIHELIYEIKKTPDKIQHYIV